jgi:hypothetical protein
LVEVGDIVRVLSINNDKRLISPKTWGIVMSIEDARFGAVCARLLKWTVKMGVNRPFNSSGVGWNLGREEYQVVPDEDVPDEIWALLAHWRLTDA